MEAVLDDYREKTTTSETNLLNIALWSDGAYRMEDLYEMPPYMLQILYKQVKEKIKVSMTQRIL